MKIYFDKDKNAIAEDKYMSERAVCIIDESLWNIYCEGTLGADYDIENNQFVKLVSEEEMTNRKNAEKKIYELKKNIRDTDHFVLEYVEGLLTEEEFGKVKEQRAEWRNEIEELENKYLKKKTPYGKTKRTTR